MAIIITNEGNQLLRDAVITGKKVDFTQIELIADPKKSPGEMSYLVNVNSVEAQENDTVIVNAHVKNDGFTETYYFNRVNVYANTEKVLFAYDDACNICIPPETIKVLNSLNMYLKIATSSTELKVTYGTYVLKEDYDKTVAKVNRNTEIVDKNTEDLRIASVILQGVYEGADLTAIHAEEIKEHANPWAWIKSRINNRKFEGIYVGDYIPITVNDEKVKMQVAGIDTYYRATDQQLGHHIDFISKDCVKQTVKWSASGNNNGNDTNAHPYMASDLRTYLNGTLLGYIPAEVKAVIKNKRDLLERRYDDTGVKLEDGTATNWYDIGALWVPSEYEVFGSSTRGSKKFSTGLGVQYPIFARGTRDRVKGLGDGGRRCNWWLSTVASESSTNCVRVEDRGQVNTWGASSLLNVPVCFRIGD